MARKSEVTMVTERGQVSIPAGLRRDFDLEPGRKVRWEKVTAAELRVVVLLEEKPRGAAAMLGYARCFREQLRRTADWMRVLREGES